jgi:hypothetical protein
MKQANPKLALITAVIFATILTISITTTPLLQPVYGAMNRVALYSGPRASMAVSDTNNIYLTWWDNKTGNNEVFFAKSNDSGKTFDKPINLSNAKGGSADSQIAASGDNVFVTWWDNKTGSWQVFSRASTDGGKTFADGIILKSIGTSAVKVLKAPSSDTISVDTLVAASGNNNEYAVWWDNTTGNWEVLFTRSTDGGKTFGDPVNISNSPDARSVGARIATDKANNVYVSWIDIDKNTGQKQVLFRSSNDNGKTFGSPVIVGSSNATSSGTG